MNKKTSKTLNIVMYVVLGLLFVGALIGIIYGVSTHEEPTVSDQGRWHQSAFPLRVSAHRYTSEGNQDVAGDTTVTAVLDTVNDRLGFTAYRLAAANETADVAIVMGVPSDEGWDSPGGDFVLRGSEGFYDHCDIRTSNTGTVDLLWRTLYHELGHCLGLRHDDYEQSIMFPDQVRTPDGQLPPWISDHDRAKLRELYAPSSGDGTG